MDLSPVIEAVQNGNGVAVVPVADLCRAVGHKGMGSQVTVKVGAALAEAGLRYWPRSIPSGTYSCTGGRATATCPCCSSWWTASRRQTPPATTTPPRAP